MRTPLNEADSYCQGAIHHNCPCCEGHHKDRDMRVAGLESEQWYRKINGFDCDICNNPTEIVNKDGLCYLCVIKKWFGEVETT